MFKSDDKEENIIYKTQLGFLEILITIAFIVLLFLIILLISYKYYSDGIFIILILSSIYFLMIIQIIRGTKTFYLSKSSLIIKRPFLLGIINDKEFKINDIKEIIFRTVQGRFGGPHIIIKSKKETESYKIDIKQKDLELFIKHLTTLEIKTIRDKL